MLSRSLKNDGSAILETGVRVLMRNSTCAFKHSFVSASFILFVSAGLIFLENVSSVCFVLFFLLVVVEVGLDFPAEGSDEALFSSGGGGAFLPSCTPNLEAVAKYSLLWAELLMCLSSGE